MSKTARADCRLTSVGLSGVDEVVNGALVKEEPKHAAGVTAGGVVAVFLRGRKDALHQLLRHGLKLLVCAGPLKDLQCLSRRGENNENTHSIMDTRQHLCVSALGPHNEPNKTYGRVNLG